jgi:2-C-methyl-D-erythritol 4-phosphate cytidylyltransferase
MSHPCTQFVAVVPAAGVGKRMQSTCPKQYLLIQNKTILEQTVTKLLSHELIKHVVISISDGDEYFQDTSLSTNKHVTVVFGGKERVDSVLAGLMSIDAKVYPWAMVHDAARPCVDLDDISQLIEQTQRRQVGGLLATPVRDTMKKSSVVHHHSSELKSNPSVEETVERENLWHALTPQLYRTNELINAISTAQKNNVIITDESSAIEAVGLESILVEGRGDNIKITRPDDLALANFILSKQISTNNMSAIQINKVTQ